MKLSVTSRQTNALLLLFPLMLLTGCATQQKPLVEYRTITQKKLPIPAELTRQLDVPAVMGPMTFGDSVLLNAELYGIIDRCNSDRAAMRLLDSQ